MLFVYSRPVRAAYFPVILFFNTIPVLALAPIIILIFGLGLLPKIIIAAIICFFPTLVNMVRGLNLPTPNELRADARAVGHQGGGVLAPAGAALAAAAVHLAARSPPPPA